MRDRSDLEQMRDMLQRAGIEFGERYFVVGDTIHAPPNLRGGLHSLGGRRSVEIVVNRGYKDFHTSMSFLMDTGELIDMGAYE